MKINLSELNEKQLEKLKADIDKELVDRTKHKLAEARKAVEEAAKKHGFSLQDVIGGGRGRGKAAAKAAGAPKYRNPADASQTWSGRGRQPEWFKAAIASGKSPDDMAI
ncbi:H-NS family nucleoid-associated regulatory protein [Palleronia sp. KMU-117]|uniref:H-NS histone family protein n=1 Tax=Palleronia sp. KMU-117 TaxID=3434108 RepID=UPI003D741E38